MEDLLAKTVGNIVAADYRTASVFEKNGIDFCCKGNVSLSQALAEKNLDPEEIIADLNALKEVKSGESDSFDTMPLPKLVDHIEETHHQYVRSALPQLQVFVKKLCEVHGQRHKELDELKQQLAEAAGNLSSHMKKEEQILFPYVRLLAEAEAKGLGVNAPPFGSVQNPISMMEHEHDTEGRRFEQIRKISGNYTVPEDGCNTYKVTFSMLKEFEADLHKHIHLENNILFPKAIELEARLLNRNQ